MNNKICVLGVNISNNNKRKTVQLIKHAVTQNSKLFISTVNASFFIKAQNDKDFYNILQSKTDLNLPDGVSIQLASEYLSLLPSTPKFKSVAYFIYGLKVGLQFIFNKKFTVLKNRVTGVYLTKKLLKIANKYKWHVVVLHRADGLVTVGELQQYLSNKYPNVKSTVIGISLLNDFSVKKLPINYNLCFCTLGEVYQEKLLNTIQKKQKFGVYIGVGSSFDVLLGKISSVKLSHKRRGLEWLVRLIKRPKRIKKVLRSVVSFPLIVYKYSLKHTK